MKGLLLFVTAGLFLAACTEYRLLERISLVTLIGYDIEDDQIDATTVVRQINPEFESSVEIHSETAKTSKGTRVKADLKTAKTLMAGQLRVVLFGDELAEEGIGEAIHTLAMNSEITTSIYLGVVEGTSKNLLESEYPNITDIGQHVFNLMDHNIKQQQMISSTLHEVVRDIYSPLRDFTLPVVKKEGEYIDMSGIALFQGGTMVGMLPASDSFYVLLIRQNINDGTLQLILPADLADSTKNKPKHPPKNFPIAIDAINSKRKIKVMDHSKNEIDLTITLDCRLLEIHSSLAIGDQKVTEKIEEAMNKKIESEITRIIKYSQEVNSDIFGFGEHFHAQVRDAKLTEEKWHELYPKMKVNVKIETEIIRSGVVE
ncbi:Ger(x)C family spore germination protein [Ureibacillus galli]|nr:Ger(x)C family spore germination protein [Ureibacillus galli]